MNQIVLTDADYDSISWHDCIFWRISFPVGNPSTAGWASELLLDIDYILDAVSENDTIQYRIAPATILFKDVTDLRIDIDWGSSGNQNAIHEVAIDSISRVLQSEAKVCLDRPYYSWEVTTNWPTGGKVAFGASGFVQTLLSDAIVCPVPSLPQGVRNRIIGASAPGALDS